MLPISEEQIRWADVIFVMEGRLLDMLQQQFAAELDGKEIVCLEIPDDYQFMQADLMALLQERLHPLSGAT